MSQQIVFDRFLWVDDSLEPRPLSAEDYAAVRAEWEANSTWATLRRAHARAGDVVMICGRAWRLLAPAKDAAHGA